MTTTADFIDDDGGNHDDVHQTRTTLVMAMTLTIAIMMMVMMPIIMI